LAASESADPQGWSLFAETERFRYYVRPGDHIPRWSMELAEEQLDAALDSLDLEYAGTIPFYKHASQQDLQEATGSRSTGVVMPSPDGGGYELHSVHRYDAHEVMHVLAHTTLGEPPAFFDEGLATAFAWDWTPDEQDVHARARRLLAEGRLVSVERLLTNWGFRSYQSYPAYVVAGSFTKYLLATRGPVGLSELFALDRFSVREEIEAHFAAAYGEPISAVEKEWRSALTAGELAPSPAPEVAGEDRTLVVTGILLFSGTFLGAVMLIVTGERVTTQVVRCVRSLMLEIRQ
jgi:hypothetical protein